MRQMTAKQFRQKFEVEKHVSQQVRDFLEPRGWRRIRFQATVIPGSFRTAEPGMSDTLFIKYLTDEDDERAGLAAVIWIETKRFSRGKRSEDQVKWHHREKKLGAITRFVNDIDDFMREYDRLFGWLHRPGMTPDQLRFELQELF